MNYKEQKKLNVFILENQPEYVAKELFTYIDNHTFNHELDGFEFRENEIIGYVRALISDLKHYVNNYLDFNDLDNLDDDDLDDYNDYKKDLEQVESVYKEYDELVNDWVKEMEEN